MKFVTYSEREGQTPRFGFKKGKYIVDVLRASIWARNEKNHSEFLEIPTNLKRALVSWTSNLMKLRELDDLLPVSNLDSHAAIEKPIAIMETDITFHPPVPNPSTFRDFTSCEQVKGIIESGESSNNIPYFYFSNPNSLYGQGAVIPFPRGTNQLDFELEFAIIIANGGPNITKDDADLVVGGFTILNDWTARDIEREETQLSRGPVKSKDFATSIGPYMVTPDELSDTRKDDAINLPATCHVNDKLLYEGNTRNLRYPVASMIERASWNANLIPGDYIGSGTIGKGSIAELGPEKIGGWLQPGDVVRLTIDRLGQLVNTIQ